MRIILLFFILLMVSCKGETKKEVEVIEKTPVILVSDLEMEMPGNIYLTNDFIIVENPFPSDNFFYVYQKDNGKFVGKFGVKGKSATEFHQACLVVNRDTCVTVYDMNMNNCVVYSLNDFQITAVHSGEVRDVFLQSYTEQINGECYAAINWSKKGNRIALCNRTDTIATYGASVVDGDFRDYEHNVGSLCFDKRDSVLYYMSATFPFVEKYQFSNGRLSLLSEEKYGEFDYEVINGSVRSKGDVKLRNFSVMTNDYFVEINKTPEEIEALKNYVSKSGRDYNVLPMSLFAYDKKFELTKIVKTNTKILRCEGDVDSNTLYLVVYIDGVFNIAKVDL